MNSLTSPFEIIGEVPDARVWAILSRNRVWWVVCWALHRNDRSDIKITNQSKVYNEYTKKMDRCIELDHSIFFSRGQ